MGRSRKEAGLIGASLLFLAAGIAIAWLAQDVADIEGDAVLVALLVIPVVMYLLLSGRISELKAPGGLEIKLREVANQSVAPTSQEALFEPALAVAKGASVQRAENLPEETPIVMTLVQGRMRYARTAVLDRLTELAQWRSLRFLVVLDADERVVAYLPQRSAVHLLNDPARGQQLIDLVNGGDPEALAHSGLPGLVTVTLRAPATNAEALALMDDHNLEALAVVDVAGRFLGIVERQALLSKMMLAITPG